MPLCSLAVLGLLTATAIVVRVDGPASCELESATAAALARYLGRSTGPDLELELEIREAEVDLRLRSEKRAVLERRLDLSADECVAIPDAAALIVERFFRDLGWTPGMPELPMPPVEDSSSSTPAIPPPVVVPAIREPPAPPPPPPPPDRSPAAEPSRASPEEPGAPRALEVPDSVPTTTTTRSSTVATARRPLDVALHLGAEVRGALPLEIGGIAKLELSIAWFRFTTEGGFARPESWTVSRAGAEIGQISAWVAQLDFGLGACWSGPVRLCGRGSGGFESVFGQASGDIFQTSALVRSGPRLGLGGTVEWALSPGWELTASLIGLYRPAPSTFTVEDAEQTGYSRPNLSVLLGIGFRAKIF